MNTDQLRCVRAASAHSHCTSRRFYRICLTLFLATAIAFKLPPHAGNTQRSDPRDGDYVWAGIYVSTDKASTLTISGAGGGMTARGRWTPSTPQTDASDWINCTLAGATATCQVLNGHYHDADKDQYYGGVVTATLSGGTRLVGQTTIIGEVREEWRVSRYPSAHHEGAVFPFDVRRTTPAQAVAASTPLQPTPNIAKSGTVTVITRKVEIQHSGSSWVPAGLGMALVPGDKVHTGFKGSVSIQLPNGHVVQMNQLSMILITDNGIFLQLGEVSAQVGRKGRGASDFEVKTPTCGAGVRGTIFSVSVNELPVTTVSVVDGEVLVSPTNSSLRPVTLYGGQQIRVGANQVWPVTGTANAGSAVGCGLGTTWDETEAGSWTSVWTRRGESDVFDANYLNGRAFTVNTLTIQGNRVSIRRTQSSDNNPCSYEGTIAQDGATVTGTYTCDKGGGGNWRATIHCKPAFVR
jgi:FecR protein